MLRGVARKVPSDNDSFMLANSKNNENNSYNVNRNRGLSDHSGESQNLVQNPIADFKAHARNGSIVSVLEPSLPHSHTGHTDGTESAESELEDLHRFKSSPNAIANLFEAPFANYSKLELNRLVDGGVLTARVNATTKTQGFKSKVLGISDNGNQNAQIQELKTALKSVLDGVETLKKGCIEAEKHYKQTTIDANKELRKSMNILYDLQQKKAQLQESEEEQKKLSRLVL